MLLGPVRRHATGAALGRARGGAGWNLWHRHTGVVGCGPTHRWRGVERDEFPTDAVGGTWLGVAGAVQRRPQRPGTSRVPRWWLLFNGPPPSSGAGQGTTPAPATPAPAARRAAAVTASPWLALQQPHRYVAPRTPGT